MRPAPKNVALPFPAWIPFLDPPPGSFTHPLTIFFCHPLQQESGQAQQGPAEQRGRENFSAAEAGAWLILYKKDGLKEAEEQVSTGRVDLQWPES